MARPSKPVSLIKFEGKSHRTPQELKFREKQEQALLTGRRIKEAPEVKSNEDAHAEFRRVVKLLEAIQKNDALYEAAINRYCLLRVEEKNLQELRTVQSAQLTMFMKTMNEKIETGQLEYKEAYDTLLKLQQAFSKTESQLSQKRKELLTIEKEHAMTIAAALRAIPKTPEKTKTALLEALGG